MSGVASLSAVAWEATAIEGTQRRSSASMATAIEGMEWRNELQTRFSLRGRFPSPLDSPCLHFFHPFCCRARNCRNRGPLAAAALGENGVALKDAMQRRITKLAVAAANAEVRLMIDAEQSWLQPAIDNTVYSLQVIRACHACTVVAAPRSYLHLLQFSLGSLMFRLLLTKRRYCRSWILMPCVYGGGGAKVLFAPPAVFTGVSYVSFIVNKTQVLSVLDSWITMVCACFRDSYLHRPPRPPPSAFTPSPSVLFPVSSAQCEFNKEFPTIFTTYQCYLKDSLERLEMDLDRASRGG